MAVKGKVNANARPDVNGSAAFLAHVKKVEAIYKRARTVEANSFGNDNNQEVPEGVYTCKLTGINIGVGQQSKRPFVSHQWKVAEGGDYDGETFSVVRSIDTSNADKTRKSFEGLCRDTQLFGVGTKDASLEEVVAFWEEQRQALENGKLHLCASIKFAASKNGNDDRKWVNLNKIWVDKDGGGGAEGKKAKAKK